MANELIRLWECDEGTLIGPYEGLLLEETTEERPTEPNEDGRWPIDVSDRVRITDQRWRDPDEREWSATKLPTVPAYLSGDWFWWEPMWPEIQYRDHPHPKPKPREAGELQQTRTESGIIVFHRGES